ncbi:helix-turn-helix domain-containing protein [Amycolatopsis jejuensis]|uniref:helix-turn-helix domain-containing protein n=1 Tax=Amycolatopsis jejuensis TaxID=330084 RepID=UPI0005271A82|nr:cupin domain-containing protein [Amycolatopsis jejuensis]
MTKPSDDAPPEIGPYLRALRKQRGLSLQQVALATGISKSFLSLVENGTNDITFGRLHRLLTLYGADLGDLVPPREQAEESVVRGTERRLLYRPAPGMGVFMASPDTRRTLLAGVALLEPGSRMPEDAIHDGEEWVHVVRGAAEVVLDDGETMVELSAGDSIYLRGGRRHRLANPSGETEAEVISVLSQGGTADRFRR